MICFSKHHTSQIYERVFLFVVYKVLFHYTVSKPMYCPIDSLLEKWVNHLIPCRFFEKNCQYY